MAMIAQLLSAEEIARIEQKYPNGISSGEIVKIFRRKGIKFSEATFRKYVQMGLIARCKRVGQKGKHRGSSGVYLTATVERINTIKRLIAGDVTLEQLRHSYFTACDKVGEAARAVEAAIKDLERYESTEANALRRDLDRAYYGLQRVEDMLDTLAQEQSA